MPYVKKTIVAGDTIEIHKGYSSRIGLQIPRGKNINPTPADVAEVNRRNAEMKCRWTLDENFRAKDIHMVLTYRRDQRPPPQVAKKHLEIFLRGCRKIYRKQGITMKYIAATSYASPVEEDADDEEMTAMHHHIVISSIDVRDLLELWPYGSIRPTYLYKRWGVNDFSLLAAYIIKQTDKTFRLPDSPSKRRYNPSRNLTIPEPKVEIVNAATWVDKPKALAGYTLVEKSIRDWTCKYTGHRCQEYRMVKKPEPQAKKRDKPMTAPQKSKSKPADKLKPNKNRRC